MTLAQIDAHVSDHAPHITGSGTEHEYRVEKGDFVAVVESYAGRYSFFVRDMRRERPTIHGYGVDFPHAVMAVTQLLDALTGER